MKDSYSFFWRIISKSDDIVIPLNVQKSGSLDLLKYPSLPLLFYRVLHTDILVKTLALACEYKSHITDFSLDDTEKKIATIILPPISQTIYSIRKNSVRKKNIPLDPMKYSIGERVLGIQISYPEVSRLLH